MNAKSQAGVTDTIEAAAAQWLSRRDRALTPTEQDEYLQWLAQDPRHGQAITRLEKAWGALDALSQWRPAHSTVPNPDLLAPRHRARWYWLSTAFAAAAAIALAFYAWAPATPRSPAASPRREAIIHPGPERQTLADGSVVELNQGARIEVNFSKTERHVRLVAGEAHFAVAKNPNWPFFVDTDKVSVRAVGTAFSVTLAKTEVAVLVTEGKVQVMQHSPLDASGKPRTTAMLSLRPAITLVGGQRTVVKLESDGSVPAAAAQPAPAGQPAPAVASAAPADDAPVIEDMTPAEIERALSWQRMRLEFVDMPLGDVASTFNRFNRIHLVVKDDETAAMIVGGSFRADNIDGFVRLLEATFNVRAEPHGETEIVLRKAR
ncbi:MAG: FecR domain-containing protein [Verrucomicrobia bacterium]|nr:FecR domain-containing protein [Verrucomicrobiota bacterium]